MKDLLGSHVSLFFAFITVTTYLASKDPSSLTPRDDINYENHFVREFDIQYGDDGCQA